MSRNGALDSKVVVKAMENQRIITGGGTSTSGGKPQLANVRMLDGPNNYLDRRQQN